MLPCDRIDRHARKEALSIDPIDLTLGKHVRETTALNGVFGALRDSGPDHWGGSLLSAMLASPISAN
jgi:serine/threonine-protein kinase HipA